MRPSLLTSLSLALALLGCDANRVVSPGSELLELAAAQRRWESIGNDSYDFTVRFTCFCVEPRLMLVRVEEGAVISVRPVGSNEELTGPARARFVPIDSLFRSIRAAIARDPFAMRTSYDPVMGYPVDVYIDQSMNIADEEWGFLIGDVELQFTGD